MFAENELCIAENLYKLLRTTRGWTPERSSNTTLIPSRSDSSRRSGDALDLAGLYEGGDLLDERRLVDLVGKFVDDDLHPVGPAHRLDLGLGANDDLAAAGGVGVSNAGRTHDGPAGRKIRTLYECHQLLDRGIGVVGQVYQSVADLGRIVGRDIGSHADGDPDAPLMRRLGSLAGRTTGSRRVPSKLSA